MRHGNPQRSTLMPTADYYCVDDFACPLNTVSMAACAHFSPSPLDTPIAPITWPLSTMGTAPGGGKSFMKVGARFSPLRTILLVSDVGRRQRRADFALSSAVSMAFPAAPSMACDSTTLPPQSRIAIATVSLFCWAHAVQASASARAPALEMTVTVLVSLTSPVACAAEGAPAKVPATNTESTSRPYRMRMRFLLLSNLAVLAPGGDSATEHDRIVAP